jgi:hypothetical protein
MNPTRFQQENKTFLKKFYNSMDEIIPSYKFHNSPHSSYAIIGISTKTNLTSHSFPTPKKQKP